MKNLFKYLIIILSSMTLFACGSSGGGDDDDDSTVSVSIPSDATTITSANATPVARSAVGNVVLFGAITDFSQKGSASPSTGDVIKLVIDRAFDRNRHLAERTETLDCGDTSASGTITVDYDETATTETGSVSFNDCDLGGLVIDGQFTYSSTFNETSGAYSDNGNGSLTMTASGQPSLTIAMDYSETGNDMTGDFSATISISVSGDTVANYLMTTTQPITGDDFDIISGQILVEGAGGTRLRITVTTPNMADVELDDGSGTFVFHSTINIF